MLVRAFAGQRVRAPYGLRDMAADAFALLDHLGLEAAHLVGVSMGGMVAQTMAIEHPKRVLSLTSIMSTTGKRSVGWQHPRLLPALIGRRGRGRTAYAEGSAAIWALIGSPLYPADPADMLAKANETFDRGWSAGGVLRQMLAVTTQENRSQRLHAVRVPALVVHGTEDQMVHVSAAGPPPPPSPAPSCSSSTAWATTCRRPCSRPSPTPSGVRPTARSSRVEPASRPRESAGVSTRSAVAGLAARPATAISRLDQR